MQKIISLKKNERKKKNETRRGDEKCEREKRRRDGENDGAVVDWCCRCCSTGLIAFKRPWTRRSPPLNMCFSDFIRCYPLRTLCARARFEETHGMRLSSDAPVCTAHNRVELVSKRRERDRGISVLDRWIPTCLLTKEYPIVSKPFPRIRCTPFSCTLALRFSSLFIFFPRTETFFLFLCKCRALKNKDRHEFANTAIITLPTSRLSAAIITRKWSLCYYAQLFKWK